MSHNINLAPLRGIISAINRAQMWNKTIKVPYNIRHFYFAPIGVDGMNIIIVGSGKVGYTLAENLSNEKHDVTIIDTGDAALQKASEALDVLCIKGNGASIRTLKGRQMRQRPICSSPAPAATRSIWSAV